MSYDFGLGMSISVDNFTVKHFIVEGIQPSDFINPATSQLIIALFCIMSILTIFIQMIYILNLLINDCKKRKENREKNKNIFKLLDDKVESSVQDL